MDSLILDHDSPGDFAPGKWPEVFHGMLQRLLFGPSLGPFHVKIRGFAGRTGRGLRMETWESETFVVFSYDNKYPPINIINQELSKLLDKHICDETVYVFWIRTVRIVRNSVAAQAGDENEINLTSRGYCFFAASDEGRQAPEALQPGVFHMERYRNQCFPR